MVFDTREAAARSNALSEAIAARLIAHCSINGANSSLWSGKAGAALYLSYLHSQAPQPALRQHARELASAALDDIAAYPVSGLYQHVWTIWAARTVDVMFKESENSAFCDDLDGLLLESLWEIDAWNGRYELISGLLGIGAYALTAMRQSCGRQIAERVVQLLLSRSSIDGNWQWWYTLPADGTPSLLLRHPKGYCDLGLAHGNAGVMAFLSQTLQHGILAEESAAALTRLVPWMLAQRNTAAQMTSFPFLAEDAEQTSRCAWCYGDLGIAWALRMAGLAMERHEWSALSQEIARRLITLPPPMLGISDYALCHGWAGTGHILRCLADDFNDEDLRTSARHALHTSLIWQEQQLQLRDEDSASLGFLEGAPGIALALLSGFSGLPNHWHYPLLLA
ncbi:lanthionine synthetase C family protein [Massilia sp. MB5]|uniref:lanthionine synthetase C family protein n=1 Tax=Massilia sp. MB5 TaxID=2919578 RepID=UPI001F0F073D|nr:lanthionine synthetase C family protein [Massilia sp. MB5]UMR29232.1 lanthionine synthetase C family protein [Massilia sp. MB5]